MALPPTVRVKLSSEAVEVISLTPVVVQDLPVRDLIEHMLGITGKDEGRIREILLRGTLVSGASRFRWPGWQADDAGIRDVLATFPDPDPSLAFSADRCIRATLRGGRQNIELPRDPLAKKGLFKRQSFWDALMDAISPGARYVSYSYRDRADRFVRDFTLAEADRLRSASTMIGYTTLQEQVRSVAFTHAELIVTR